MQTIQQLTEDLINKIAAGEVIERPASVVKELVENALDAGATQITIDIKDSGKELIKITDNGHGMTEENAKMSILRHATSKISNATDLFNITTLGFRGEALASIAAISQLSIITKPSEQMEAFNIVIEGGNIISTGILAAEQGTTIEVRNLFFNTPARKKFLKSDSVELRHIIDVITRYALGNPNIGFSLSHEGHSLVTAPAVEDAQNKIASVYGVALAKDLLPVAFENEFVRVSGYIAKPNQARNDKNQQVLFVNGRWVRNVIVNKAIYDGYHSLLFVGKHPVYVLFLEVNPEKVDVNVHPQKSEIKIEQQKEISQAIETAIRETLARNNLIPVVDFSFDEKPIPAPKYTFEPSTQTILQPVKSSIIEEYSTPEEEVIVREQAVPALGLVKLPQMKILGQIHKTFFVAETPGGVLFIDQHVVQERVYYEQFMQQFMHKKVATQTLLQGEILELSPQEKLLIVEHESKLKQLGFTIEHFGGNSYVVKTIPSVFGRMQPLELVREVLSTINENRNKLEEIQEEIITRMACRASVKAGDTVSIPHLQKMLAELSQCHLPYHCPHGRAIFITMPVSELDKKFQRK
ncbi:DNA mismatch repair endonuclease MutL [Candidatus Woesearchaeota archaeon]|jgi:DNA mismatch repair protein MutL|nr:DNA mismatch repair endonuclease MutL [Candidatus Woesearchaeota archaeon]MBT5740246.1 DNA mismatch repair endonuclease MutL [Candidatus Woesearchaeota archaeon]